MSWAQGSWSPHNSVVFTSAHKVPPTQPIPPPNLSRYSLNPIPVPITTTLSSIPFTHPTIPFPHNKLPTLAQLRHLNHIHLHRYPSYYTSALLRKDIQANSREFSWNKGTDKCL